MEKRAKFGKQMHEENEHNVKPITTEAVQKALTKMKHRKLEAEYLINTY